MERIESDFFKEMEVVPSGTKSSSGFRRVICFSLK
jgi:hypothetical protein